MKLSQKRDKEFLKALVDYAEKSGTTNPHFHKTEMMEHLGIDELTFNLLQKRLGSVPDPCQVHICTIRW